MVSIKGIVSRLFGKNTETQALDEKQTDDESRIGMLKREFAGHPGKGLTPAKLHRILEDAEQGDIKAQHELFEDMEEKDAQIAADMGKRRELAAELEWQIVPPDNASAVEKKAAEFCNEVFSGLEVEDLIIEMASGIGHGWAMLELPWTVSDGKRIVLQPIFRPHAWFRLNQDDQNELRLRDLSPNGAELWPLGWVQHRHKAKAGYVARSGLLRVLAWPYLFENYAMGDLAELLEIYGIPARIGTYPRNATDKEKATLLRAVTSIGHSAAGIIPEGMLIDFKEAADGKGNLFETMLQWCQRAKARAILGSTLTSGTGEGTNTNALGNVHERSQQSLIRSDVRQYAGTINRDILWPMAALNFGIEDRRRAPSFFLDTGEAEDFKLLAESLPKFVDMGAKVPVWWLHEKTRIPQAAEGEETLRQTAAPQPAALTGVAALTGQAPAAPYPADLIADRLAALAQPEIDGWIERIRAMLDTADSLEHFRELLLAAYADLPEDKLAAVLTEAMTAADAAGRFDLTEGSDG
ncbi:MAG: DUF935 domain-containing protein [Thermodesulfobacteriota bacterium]